MPPQKDFPTSSTKIEVRVQGNSDTISKRKATKSAGTGLHDLSCDASLLSRPLPDCFWVALGPDISKVLGATKRLDCDSSHGNN